MNEDKEINELATEIYTLFRSRTMSRALASLLYRKGWRKQSEGEWLGSGQTDEYICSLCGGIAPVDCEKEDFYKSNFCPNCGAKMKGGA